MVRQPAVAGKFYTNEPDQLRKELRSMVVEGEQGRALGIVAPHAGYVYSGMVAGRVYGAIRVPDAVILLGPNHTGMGYPAAISPLGEWLTPLGAVPVNAALCELVVKHAPKVREDATAHRFEHSLEVQVPFLQYRNPNVTITPICLSYLPFETVTEIGEGLARAITEYGKEVLIVASSDMTHYESAQTARAKDEAALAELTALNPQGLLAVCRDRDITMCGVMPAAVMLTAANQLGARQSWVISYSNSGEVNGDLKRVVGYAAVAVS
ncbi:AmmeMemoRadiSam system protein B [Geomonas sp. Red32]|uniref:AmmeMemoRadiSam system protein B n=1 Tax=Geomonas sp. Red32 TaxID=2912856 RepID=UPI00202CFD5D|nr:AmmeMemoRadiSam system protein B [Geomonas sp. Red32]MCM0083222.1 AmmeMemoRadiSam system protein B [Geomonas sp. Red32]